MAIIGLNPQVKQNYAFFDKESGLHLSLTNPTGTVTVITARIKRGLDFRTLLRLDKEEIPVVNIEAPIQDENGSGEEIPTVKTAATEGQEEKTEEVEGAEKSDIKTEVTTEEVSDKVEEVKTTEEKTVKKAKPKEIKK